MNLSNALAASRQREAEGQLDDGKTTIRARCLRHSPDWAEWALFREGRAWSFLQPALPVEHVEALARADSWQPFPPGVYIGDWCADPGLSHELCTDGACECACHKEAQ